MLRILAAVVIAGLVIAVLLPARRTARGSAHRVQCSSNLKQIALAIEIYYDVYQAFPPASTVAADGTPLHSWRTLILPYLEQGHVYKLIDLEKPWNDPANAAAFNTNLDIYRCPAGKTGNLPKGHTAYLAIVTPDSLFRARESHRRSEVQDGSSNTWMLIEAPLDQSVHWMTPTDADEALVLGIGERSKLAHPNGFHTACVDCSVRFAMANSSAEGRRAQISIAGNDNSVDEDN